MVETAPFIGTLRNAGRLDIVYQCILMSMFASHAIRRDVEFHAFLYGRPNPPIHLTIDGGRLYDVRVDEETWRKILNETLSGAPHEGVGVKKEGIEPYAKSLDEVYVLNENGEDIERLNFKSPSFFLGDHVGLPNKFEKSLIAKGAKSVSLGKNKYLASSTIDIVNYLLDRKGV